MTNDKSAREREVLAETRAMEILADVHGYQPADNARRVDFLAGHLIPIILPVDAVEAMTRYGNERAAQEREANAAEQTALERVMEREFGGSTPEMLISMRLVRLRIANVFSAFARAQGQRGTA